MNSSENLTQMDASNNITPIYWIAQTIVYPILFTAYILVLFVIIKYRQEFKNSYFTLVIALGISDLVTLLYVLHGFICCLTNSNYMGVIPDLIVTALYNSLGWYSGFYLNVIMSINRFIAISMFSKYKRIWTPKRTVVAVLCCFILGVITNIPFATLTPAIFNLSEMRDTALDETADIEELEYFDLITGCGMASFILIIYVISMIISLLRIQNLTGVRKQYIREIKMLIQGTIIACMLILLEIMYYFPLIGNMSFIISSMLATGLNPIIYIILDFKLRQRVFIILKVKSYQITRVTSINLPALGRSGRK